MKHKGIGLHVQAHLRHDWAVEYAAAVRPSLMKFLHFDRGTCERVKQVSPGTRIVFRHYWSDQTLRDSGQRREFNNAVVKRARECAGVVDWIEGWNEAIAISSDEGTMRRFCGDEIDTAKQLNDAGMGAAIGGFSTGAWDLNDGKMWRAVEPMMRFLHETHLKNVLHFHEYSAPYMAWGVRTPDGLNQWDHAHHRAFGFSAQHIWQPTLDGWWTLRWRMARARLLQAGLGGVNFIITESGIDDIQPRPGPQGKGWRDYAGSEWDALLGDYAEQMAWYAWQAAHDDYLLGIVDFGFATVDPQWRSFDLSLDRGQFEHFMAAQVSMRRRVETETGGEPVESRFLPLLRERARQAGVEVEDLRGSLVTAGAFGALDPRNVEAVAVHHTAASPSVTWQSVAQYHVGTRDFAGIGYHVGVRNGRISYLGDVDSARAHVKGENHRYLGLCLAGNYQSTAPSEGDMKALRAAYLAMLDWLGRSVPARSHKELAPPGYTVCCGSNLIARLGELSGEGGSALALALGKWADLGQSIQPNEAAALYRVMREDGYWPLSDESGARGAVPSVEGFPGIVAQLGRDWDSPTERVYYWDGQRVRFVPRG